MPLLEVVTRCYKRPQMLARNQASLEGFGSHQYQVLLVDEVGRGIPWSYQQFAQHEPVGRWVWILDDDDECIYPQLAADIQRIDADHSPDVVMVKMDHGAIVLPDPAHWRLAPVQGHLGVSAYIIKREVWMQHRHAFAFDGGRYESDYDFISSVFAADPEVYWHNVIASRAQRVSKGQPE